jgi:hypothetical protein
MPLAELEVRASKPSAGAGRAAMVPSARGIPAGLVPPGPGAGPGSPGRGATGDARAMFADAV